MHTKLTAFLKPPTNTYKQGDIHMLTRPVSYHSYSLKNNPNNNNRNNDRIKLLFVMLIKTHFI